MPIYPGATFLPMENLLERSEQLLNVSRDQITICLNNMVMEKNNFHEFDILTLTMV